MRKTAGTLLILSAVALTAVSCATYERPERPEWVLTNPPIERKVNERTAVKPPFLPGMEPEGTFEEPKGPTIAETVEALRKDGKVVPMAPEMGEIAQDHTVTDEPLMEAPVIEECAEDTTEPEIMPASETEETEVLVIEDTAVKEEKGREVPPWLDEVPVSETDVYFVGSAKNWSSLMSGMMLAETDALETAKLFMQDEARRITAEYLGIDIPLTEGKLSYVPVALDKTKEAHTSENGKLYVLIKITKASMTDYMAASSEPFILENIADPGKQLEAMDALRVSFSDIL